MNIESLENETISSVQQIEVASCTVRELFQNRIPGNAIYGNLSIPEYQRPYVWGKKELKKLLDDLGFYFRQSNADGPLYYLGSIILHQKGNQLHIIDGQQRVTTLALIDLILNDSELPIQYHSPASMKRIRENYVYLADLKDKLSNIDLSQINVSIISTGSEDDAYTFFETQNTGGVRLTGIDIIKAHHLRAINSKLCQTKNAQKWEGLSNVEEVANMLIKSRYWNYLRWKEYPSFREEKDIKNTVINEFSSATIKEEYNYSYSETIFSQNNWNGSYVFNSISKAIRQPLSDGENFIDYLEEYVKLYQHLFLSANGIDEQFLGFRDKLIQGYEGTLFLKEFYEIAMICYVSKFGERYLLEAGLWIFRYIYSLRVINSRTVRENSIFKFSREQILLDKILHSFTHEELMLSLKDYTYTFNDENCGSENIKGRYILMLVKYFYPFFSAQHINKKDFDKRLILAIDDKLKNI